MNEIGRVLRGMSIINIFMRLVDLFIGRRFVID